MCEIKGRETLPAWFIEEVFGMPAFVSLRDGNKDFFYKWLDIGNKIESLRCYGRDHVNVEIQKLFQELIGEANTLYGVRLPMSPKDLKIIGWN